MGFFKMKKCAYEVLISGSEPPRVLTGQVHFHVEGSWEKIKYLGKK